METLVIVGVLVAGLHIGKTMSNPQETVPKKRHKKHKRDKKYIVYPNNIVENIGKSDEIRSVSRV